MDQKNLDGTQRYADLSVIPQRDWLTSLKFYGEPDSLITAYSPIGKSICHGDSGGPLIRKSDKTLIGVTSLVQLSKHKGEPIVLQVFTNLAYFSSWISEKTGIKLPVC